MQKNFEQDLLKIKLKQKTNEVIIYLLTAKLKKKTKGYSQIYK